MDPGLTGCLSSLPAAPAVSTEGGRASSWLLTTNLLSLLFPKNFEVEADDLVTISELGRGAYGVVEKVRHAQSGTIMAVKVSRVLPCQGALGHRTPGKLPEGGVGAEDGGGLPPAVWPLTCVRPSHWQRIRATVNSQEQKRLLMDLDVNMRTVDCFYTVTFYGALFREVGLGRSEGGGCQARG